MTAEFLPTGRGNSPLYEAGHGPVRKVVDDMLTGTARTWGVSL
ncbi:hypothetical protein [Streptomyces cacaoi]|nr:hypothetical protein [Streptomyces cacaoi]